MKGKFLFLAGTATGFVLGSKAGRQAYDRLSAKAHEMWGDPATQKVISQAETIARDAASVAQNKVSDLLDRTEASVKKEQHHTNPTTGADGHEM
ncbi:hypothetical protein SAMN05216368_10596 [Cryobacterium flavum]|uniref:YtxH domain-containing protein n=1 Tax=Cryobacterium flavum TaxID=1424659 RepID=A0A4R8V3C5_9MICO|nr:MULTISPECIES: hypothetical protein [Cryobacterium]TFB77140.1 hypothetical protein E3O21_09605 [Cryobacterium flavum]TFD13482.1 hypothetical protein E3T35_05025 [Cryobacterium sp. TMT1-2-2]SDN38275.1 hypothetical protein SAMN05216368_10596 [Cryobacterium flavum]